MALHVVLIDKNLAFLTSAQRFLETLPGVYATSFSTADRNVVSDLRESAPDLILMDIELAPAVLSKLENAMASLKKPPQVVVLSFHEKGALAQYVCDLKYAALVNKADFVNEITPIIANMQAATAAEHLV